MKSTYAVIAATALLAAACTDAPTEAPPASTSQAEGSGTVSRSQVAAERLARAVALALNDAGLRQRVKADMRGAPFAEHKLQVSDYLRGEQGGILLAKMSRATGKSRDELLALVAQAGPLEFYMPVPAHRETWTGGSDLLVAATLSEAPMVVQAYTVQGSSVLLSGDTPPSIPTLVLVPQETDFSRAMDPARSHNVNDRSGNAIGTLLDRSVGRSSRGPSMMMEECSSDPYAVTSCDGGGGGGGGGDTGGGTTTSTVQQRGVSVEEFITHMKTPNDHEPWTQGAPEFYLLLAGKYGTGIEFKNRINIPEGPWSGSDDDNNSKWRNFGAMSLILWDVDLGTRITVQCQEDDFDWSADIKVGGSTEFPDRLEPGGFPLKLDYSVTFKVGAGDDNCGSNFINMRNSQGAWYYIPNGVNDDMYNPYPPYYDGTSDLHWYGYGLKRL